MREQSRTLERAEAINPSRRRHPVLVPILIMDQLVRVDSAVTEDVHGVVFLHVHAALLDGNVLLGGLVGDDGVPGVGRAFEGEEEARRLERQQDGGAADHGVPVEAAVVGVWRVGGGAGLHPLPGLLVEEPHHEAGWVTLGEARRPEVAGRRDWAGRREGVRLLRQVGQGRHGGSGDPAPVVVGGEVQMQLNWGKDLVIERRRGLHGQKAERERAAIGVPRGAGSPE